jgi:hypothetical protein
VGLMAGQLASSLGRIPDPRGLPARRPRQRARCAPCRHRRRRLSAKAILLVVGREVMATCDNLNLCADLNLCAGLKTGIEGAVHALRDAWEENLP